MGSRRDLAWKRRNARRQRMRAAFVPYCIKHGDDDFPGLTVVAHGRRPVLTLRKIEKTTGTIGGRPRVNPLLAHQMAPIVDGLASHFFRSRPLYHALVDDTLAGMRRTAERPAFWDTAGRGL